MSPPRIVAAGLTDVGRVREANEDAFHVGDSVHAVADGMGGHLAGEVASATALESIKQLDGKVFSEPAEAVQALCEAVIAANQTVSQMAEDEPTYHGMGTTMTAAMIEGRRLHVAHVGDSRAYLLRDGEFSQLTDDHTLVQHLIDEGQITREEAASHPQRSIITRAIGVSRDIDVDALTLELEPGDQILLCSDGLTGPVEDATIAAELTRGDDVDTTLQRLVQAALDGGGHDNITAVLLRYGDREPATGAAPGGAAPAAADGDGGTGTATVRVSTRDDRDEKDWANRLGSYGALARGGPGRASDDEGHGVGRIIARAAAIVLGVLVLLVLLLGGARFLLDQSYFVGLDGEQVVIYRGIDAEVGPIDLKSVVERTDLTVEDVPTWYAEELAKGRPATDLADARSIVNGAPRRAEEPADEPADGADVEDEPGGGA